MLSVTPQEQHPRQDSNLQPHRLEGEHSVQLNYGDKAPSGTRNLN